MRRLTIIAVVLVTMLVATSAALAVTLPSVLFLPGKTSATAKATSSSASSLETTAGSKLTGKGLEVSLTALTAGSALGVYAMVVKEEAEGKNKCKTGVLIAGNVEITGEFHLVTLSEAPLEMGLLFLVPFTTINCGTIEKPTKVKISVEGSELWSFSGTLNSEIKEFGSTVSVGRGKPFRTSYLGDGGEKLNAFLHCNFGLGFEECGEGVGEAIKFVSEGLTIDE